jgi:hypothetical protein
MAAPAESKRYAGCIRLVPRTPPSHGGGTGLPTCRVISNARFGKIWLVSELEELDALIRVRVLCSMLGDALEGLGAQGFSSPQFLDQLRVVGEQAAEELHQRSVEK